MLGSVRMISAPPMRTHMDKAHTLFPKLLFLTPTCAFIVSCAYNAALALRANFGFMIHFRIYATCHFKSSQTSVCVWGGGQIVETINVQS